MKNENLIHVKLEYGEALKARRDILLSEMNLLRIAKIIQKYHLLRSEELITKLKIYRTIKEINTNIKKLQVTLPELKIPKIIKNEHEEEKEEIEEIENKVKRTKESPYDENLEFQLQEIQEKLKSIGR